jgi:hypothetical protein
VRARTGRVCPLDCDRGYRAAGDHCVKITCDDDSVLGPNGRCRPRERAPKVVAHERKPPEAPHRDCSGFGGKVICQ